MIYKTSCSGSMLLMLGDVVTTGTPLGVGLGMKPPVFLKAEMSSNLALMALANSAKS
ncbi:2-keto-4-pentenoate hydratase/2-oxohepta-3-ene-1,7-dioic acid hydratase in catechol pathway [Rhizobium sp. AN67]|nr:2-keto-4-pentenoate hydratase/2-oxohepta-3-ene-1,7-dioic acid hydratase in catechol pathway [Rhizobium sp. AN67]